MGVRIVAPPPFALVELNVNYTQLINLDAIGIEIIRGMCGSIAIVLTVLTVSLIASWLFPLFLQTRSEHQRAETA
jgi:uncharacterized membrane protein